MANKPKLWNDRNAKKAFRAGWNDGVEAAASAAEVFDFGFGLPKLSEDERAVAKCIAANIRSMMISGEA